MIKYTIYLFLSLVFIPMYCYGENDVPIDDTDDTNYFYIKIKIDGLNKAMKKTVLKLVDLKKYNYKTDVNSNEVKATYDESIVQIKSYMISKGYYQAKLTSQINSDDDFWSVSYSILPGVQIKVKKVNVKVNGHGKEFETIQQFLTKFPIKPGDGFEHEVYEKAKTRLMKLVIDNGFLDAKYSRHEIAIDLKQHSSDINLILNTGPRYFFGEISVEENKIDPELINRFVILKKGEPYSGARILEQQNALGDSDYYSEILIKPRRELTVDNNIPIEITTRLRKPSKYSIGLGYINDSPNVSLSWSRRRLNYQGHRLYVGAAASKYGGTVGMRYRIPFRNPRYDEYVFTTNYTQEETDTSESFTTQLGLARSILRGEWREILALDYKHEIFTIGKQDETTDFLVPSATWSWVVPRGQIYISKGHVLSITARGSSKAVVSETDFIQGEVNTKWIIPVSKKGRLITRARFGASDVNDVLDLPPSYRYFTGGDQSIRGFSYKSLGPEDSTGVIIGGKHLLIGSIEYDYRLKGNWSVAAFYDAGNSFNELSEIDVARGIGVGIRWKTIVGQIRVDLASAISEPDNPRRLHLSIGPDF